MKIKRMILALVAVVAVGTTAMAQPDMPRRGNIDPAKMAQHRTEQMVKKYGLNDEQAAKLLTLNTQYADKLRPGRGHGMHRHRPGGPRPEGGGRPELTEEQKQQMEKDRKERQQAMEAYDKELQGILTADQFAKYKEDMKRRPERGPRD